MLKFAFQNLLSRPVRSTLALIGMMVAIMGMVALFSIAEGLDRVVGNTLSRVPGLVAMQRGAPIPLFSTLPKSWTEELEAIPGVKAVSPECWARANVIQGQVVVSPPRLLCGSDIIRRNQLSVGVYREDIVEGRYLNQEDLQTNHCVISRPIAEEFEKTIGDTLEVNGTVLQIVGIYYTGSILLDVAIILDDQTFRNMSRFDPGTVSSFYIEQESGIPDEELVDRIQDHFRGRGPRQWSGSMLTSGTSTNPLSQLLTSLHRFLKQQAQDAKPKP
ncbi:MAG: ABC transporter permease, partial [Planctomycetaceae bacterium]|nr:ABC transporter permease [Planctomycetaceae bacterium]